MSFGGKSTKLMTGNRREKIYDRSTKEMTGIFGNYYMLR